MMTLRAYAKNIGIDAGCGDNSCTWGAPGGMATNGGCCCLDRERDPNELRREARKLARVARHAIDALDAKETT